MLRRESILALEVNATAVDRTLVKETKINVCLTVKLKFVNFFLMS
jgi:hypothetical protein